MSSFRNQRGSGVSVIGRLREVAVTTRPRRRPSVRSMSIVPAGILSSWLDETQRSLSASRRSTLLSAQTRFNIAAKRDTHGISFPYRQWHSTDTSTPSVGNSDNSQSNLKRESTTRRQTHLQLDFFGEPVTFVTTLSSSSSTTDVKSQKKAISNAMAALDGFLLAVISKGKSCTDGGDEAGLDVRPAHASAISWSEVLRYASVWNQAINDTDDKSTDHSSGVRWIQAAPMLAVVAVAPVLAQAGSAYVQHLDQLLQHTQSVAPGMPPIQLMEMANTAVSHLEQAVDGDESSLSLWNDRERRHLQVLKWLLQDEHATALVHVLNLLRQCPGDALALSLAMDLSQTVGDKESALRAAGSVAAYWNERQGGLIRAAIPGHAMASSLMALGFSVGGRSEYAEPMAERAMRQGKKVCGGLATWAQTHIFDAEGRVSEGISALANSDGIANYEGSGFLFFDCRLGGYGARFSLDREERGRGKSKALRLYDSHFSRILEYSGFDKGRPWQRPQQRAPLGWHESKALGVGDGETSVEAGSNSMWSKMFGRGDGTNDRKEEKEKETYEILTRGDSLPSKNLENWDPTCEDVLTWLPPTPQLLADATLLLLRFTLNGTISRKDERWDTIREAWKATFAIQQKYKGSLLFSPLVSVASSIVCSPAKTGGDMVGSGRLALGLSMMGDKLELGKDDDEMDEAKRNDDDEEEDGSEETGLSLKALGLALAEREPDFWLPNDKEPSDEWKRIVDHLLSAIDGYGDVEITGGGNETALVNPSLRFAAWEFEARPILEHAIVYAACKSGDTESLGVARSICSQGVTLRPNSPEEWWRYSIVLGLLGDEVASEDALNTSINVGAGQGARKE